MHVSPQSERAGWGRFRRAVHASILTVGLVVAGAGLATAGPARAPQQPSSITTVTGQLRWSVSDDFAHKRAGRLATVEVPGRGSVPVAASTVRDLPSGASVSVSISAAPGSDPVLAASSGSGVVTSVTASTSSPSTQVSSSATELYYSSPKGRHYIALVPMYWQTTSVPAGVPSQADLTSWIGQVGTYWSTSTNGQLSFGAMRVKPWTYASALKGKSCLTASDLDAIEAQARALAGSVPNDGYHHVVAYFPQLMNGPDPTCAWDGLAHLDGDFVYLNGANAWEVLAHELGHNLGLAHSGNTTCTTSSASTTEVSLSNYCVGRPYWDPYDVMGAAMSGLLGHVSASHLDDLGLLPSSAVVSVNGDHLGTGAAPTVKITPVAAPGTAGIRLVRLAYGHKLITVEYRASTGQDVAATGDYGAGVVARLQDFSTVSADYMDQNILMTGSNFSSYAMSPGTTIYASPLTIKVISADATGATVQFRGNSDGNGPSAVSLTSPASGTWVKYFGFYATFSAASEPQTVTTNYDVYLNGTLARRVLPSALRWAWVPIPNGRYSLQIKARNSVGQVSTGPSSSINADTLAPVFSAAPTALMTLGSVSSSVVPVRVNWSVRDATAGVCSQTLTRSPSKTDSPSASAQTFVTQAAGAATYTTNTWAVRAADCLGQASAKTGPASRVTIDPASSRSSGYSGAWTSVSGSSYLGGWESTTTARGASASYSVSARSVGFVTTTAANRGYVDIYVDGVKVKSLSLYSSSTRYRQQVWSMSWSGVGTHTVKIVNQATSGRPTVSVDGITRLT